MTTFVPAGVSVASAAGVDRAGGALVPPGIDVGPPDGGAICAPEGLAGGPALNRDEGGLGGGVLLDELDALALAGSGASAVGRLDALAVAGGTASAVARCVGLTVGRD